VSSLEESDVSLAARARKRHLVSMCISFLGMISCQNMKVLFCGHPLPWEALTYNVDKGGYLVNIDKDRLDRDRAPSFRRGDEPTWDADYDTRIRAYYR